jgi:hypothetical protein
MQYARALCSHDFNAIMQQKHFTSNTKNTNLTQSLNHNATIYSKWLHHFHNQRTLIQQGEFASPLALKGEAFKRGKAAYEAQLEYEAMLKENPARKKLNAKAGVKKVVVSIPIKRM